MSSYIPCKQLMQMEMQNTPSILVNHCTFTWTSPTTDKFTITWNWTPISGIGVAGQAAVGIHSQLLVFCKFSKLSTMMGLYFQEQPRCLHQRRSLPYSSWQSTFDSYSWLQQIPSDHWLAHQWCSLSIATGHHRFCLWFQTLCDSTITCFDPLNVL